MPQGVKTPPIASARGARFLNVTDADNKTFHAAVRRAANEVFKDMDEMSIIRAPADGFYKEINWSRNPNGEDYRAALDGLGRGVAERANQLQSALGPRIDEIARSHAAKNNWTFLDRGTQAPAAQGGVVPPPPTPWSGGLGMGSLSIGQRGMLPSSTLSNPKLTAEFLRSGGV